MKHKNAGVWAGTVLLIFGVVFFVHSFSYKYFSNAGPGPGMFPLWLSGILILLSGAYFVVAIKKEAVTFDDILPKGKNLRKLLLIITALAGFCMIVPFVGFILASTLFLIILFAGEYRWYVNLVISIGISIFLFWVFDTMLTVPLPVNGLGF